MKLRLLVTRDCHRTCEGCCNKEWDLDAVPVIGDDFRFDKYELIMLTGGEPALYPAKTQELIMRIRRQASVPIVMYTALAQRAWDLMAYLDGITLTLHDQGDVYPFRDFNRRLPMWNHRSEYMKLHIFRSVDIGRTDTSRWNVSRERVWTKDCPLPDGEEFFRLEDA